MNLKIFDASGFFTNLPFHHRGNIYLHTFPTGESYCQIKDNVRGADVYITANNSKNANDALMEMMIIADAARRASAERITAVLPYFFYSRQDRKDKSRTPISAKLTLNLLEAAGFDRIISLDLHNPAIQGMTDKPFDALMSEPLFIEYIRDNFLNLETKEGNKFPEHVIISPDAGGIKRAKNVADILQLDFGFITKKRIDDTTVESSDLVGNVREKHCIILDDLSESFGTVDAATNILLDKGALSVHAFLGHSPLTKIGIERLTDSKIESVVSTNTFSVKHPKLITLDVSELFYKAIIATNQNESVSGLFEIK